MFGWVFVTRRFIAHLEAEIAWLRSEARYEKSRADRMHDLAMTLHLGQPVTTAQPAGFAEQQAPLTDEEIAKRIGADFMTAGQG
jgi:hypothetical protein